MLLPDRGQKADLVYFVIHYRDLRTNTATATSHGFEFPKS